MFTAIAIICLTADIKTCESVTNWLIFPTEEACLQDRKNAETFANTNGRFILLYKCYDWGVAT